MTPRPRIVAIRQDATLEELRELVIHEQYSRIPVYEGNIDQITGFVHVRDMFELDDEERAKRKVRDICAPDPRGSGNQAGERSAARDAGRRRAHGGGGG